MLLDTKNKNIYGLGVGISTFFEIYLDFLFLAGGDDPRPHRHKTFEHSQEILNSNIGEREW
jgi:hypothetical protein